MAGDGVGGADSGYARERLQAIWVGDHPVLDFLNTVAMTEGGPVDFLKSDEDVKLWLVGAGMLDSGEVREVDGGGLLREGQRLRETIRRLLMDRKTGTASWLERTQWALELNQYLKYARSAPYLAQRGDEGWQVRRTRELDSPKAVLGALSEAAAELLAHGDFEQIRKCEDSECVLWFYDRTKSHRRRWCSAAMCGNRNKVRAFRQRRPA